MPSFFAGIEAAVTMLLLSDGSPDTTAGTSLMSDPPSDRILTAIQLRNAEFTSMWNITRLMIPEFLNTLQLSNLLSTSAYLRVITRSKALSPTHVLHERYPHPQSRVSGKGLAFALSDPMCMRKVRWRSSFPAELGPFRLQGRGWPCLSHAHGPRAPQNHFSDNLRISSRIILKKLTECLTDIAVGAFEISGVPRVRNRLVFSGESH